ncbi:MAG: response regulator, partial [Lachnospiraceae bacterium]|nr:response regulator [Lachnospiraceae bacterium]
YICALGISSAVWCISYGVIGITEELYLCDPVRTVGVISITAFLTSEVFLVTEISGAGGKAVFAARIFSTVISLIDVIVYAPFGVDIFMRSNGRTTWVANPDFAVNRNLHSLYILLVFLELISFGIIWIRKNKVKRLRHFLTMVFAANFAMLFFTLPDTFLPEHGYPGVATSGIGAAACAIVMWYGATQLSSFDIRMGSIKDKVFDFIDAGVVVFDLSGRVALINRYAAERMRETGKAGHTLADLFMLEDLSAQEILKRSEDKIYAARFWDKESIHAYSVRVNGVKDSFEEVFCYMCVFIDVTEEVEAIRKFEVASEAKSRFLAQMSHEIRTPINAVLGMNEMILREEKDSEILDYARDIDSAGKTLLTLINSILDFSKIEDGKMEIIAAKYDTASFINDLVNSVRQRAEAKGLVFEADIDESIPCSLIGDNVRFSQIIMNLLTNAVKYTQEGTVTLTMLPEKKEGDMVLIDVAVRDTGIGIKEEDRGALFESFERLEEIRNHNIEGTGLGLSIVTSLLTLMGSTLNVESVYGEGSCFSFKLCQGIADDTPIGNYKSRLRESYENRSEQKVISAPNARVLVTDDNDINRKVCANLLRLLSIRPDIVSSGMETIERMKSSTYDVVFLDHMMPKMDGIETMKKLREGGLIPKETTVIALTANAVTGAREMYLEAGFDDYLSKPLALKELEEKLLKYLPKESFIEEPEKDGDTASFTGGDEEILEFAPEEEFAEFSPKGEGDMDDSGDSKASLSRLREIGLNVDEGLGYAAGDTGFYLEILGDFCREFKEKSDYLQSFYEDGDIKNYEVLIHAIKSNARSVGAEELRVMAAKLEEAASEGRVDSIKADHKAFMDQYRDTVRLISETIYS